MSEPCRAIYALFSTDEPAMLGSETRSGTLTRRQLDEQLSSLMSADSPSAEHGRLVRALLYLWHDHLDESHEISQSIASADGSFVHAMMHRREPDYWNSKYWWRRVGGHPAFPEIARRAGVLLKEHKDRELEKRLLPGGSWDAFAFVDVCEEAARQNNKDGTTLLREIQRIEFEVLLERFIR